ncbi:MAG: PQQ-binding-like beta-propeller repeat protein [Candidatus Baltobacteraceae bacterium]
MSTIAGSCRSLLCAFVAAAVVAGCGAAQQQLAPGATQPSATRLGFRTPASETVGWGQSYHDEGHTGYNGSEKQLRSRNVANLQLLWAASVGGGVTGFALDNGTIFAQGQGASNEPILVALDALAGTQLWSATTGSDGYVLNGTVTTGGGLVYVGCSANLMNDEQGICAFNESSGAPVWSFFNNCGCQPPASVTAPPVYSNGVLYFGYADGGVSTPNSLRAVNAATGTQLWSASFSASQSLGTAPPIVGGGEIYAGCGTNVCAFNQTDGTPLWSVDVGTEPNPALTTFQGLVFASTAFNGTDSTVVGINAITAKKVWTYTYLPKASPPTPSQPAAISGGVLYVTGTNGVLYALYRVSGKKIWSAGPGNGGYPAASAPSVANSIVYVNGDGKDGSQANTTAHSATNGHVLWSSPSNHGALSPPPIVANGILYFASPADSICSSICAYSPKKAPKPKT